MLKRETNGRYRMTKLGFSFLLPISEIVLLCVRGREDFDVQIWDEYDEDREGGERVGIILCWNYETSISQN